MVAAEAFAGQALPIGESGDAWEARALRQASEDGMALNRLNAGLLRFPDASVSGMTARLSGPRWATSPGIGDPRGSMQTSV